MRIVRDTLSLTLVTSALVGIQILVSDQWLWTAAPTHAYGLMGFVSIDIILAAAVLSKTILGAGAAILIAVSQLAAMLADRVVGQPVGVTAAAFGNYLLNDTSYLVLLAVQLGIVTAAIATMATSLIQRHASWTHAMDETR